MLRVTGYPLDAESQRLKLDTIWTLLESRRDSAERTAGGEFTIGAAALIASRSSPAPPGSNPMEEAILVA